MAGIEVAGLVLGIIPLIASSIERWEITLLPFITHGRYFKELRDLKTSLATQKQLFKNNCLMLLVTQTSYDEAEEILRKASDLQWGLSSLDEKELALDQKLSEYIGENRDSYVTIIRVIGHTLETISGDIRGLNGMTAGRPFRDVLGSDSGWHHNLQLERGLGSSQSRLKGHIEELRRLNMDFLALGESVENIHRSQMLVQNAPKVNSDSIARFKLIQAASSRLYEAVSNVCSCSVHREHSVDICLDATVTTSGQSFESWASKVHFSICLTLGTRVSSQAPIWLHVEAMMDVTGNPITEQPRLGGSVLPVYGNASPRKGLPSDILNTSDAGVRIGKKKRIPFILSPKGQNIVDSPTTKVAEVNHHINPSIISPVPLWDLYHQQDLCLHLRQYCRISPSGYPMYGDSLQESNTSRHPYFPSSSSAMSLSLETMMSSAVGDKVASGIATFERVRLARLLATAVLQFHSTPWLPDVWRSRDIFFYVDIDNLHWPILLDLPYVNLKFSRSQNEEASSKEEKSSTNYIRNTTIFSLGVVLLELAFSMPLSSLVREQDMQLGNETEFLVVRRLSKTIGSQLGAQYGTIVRKCLDCDFGVGEFNLEDELLQLAFYRDVICKLDELESVLKLDSPYIKDEFRKEPNNVTEKSCGMFRGRSLAVLSPLTDQPTMSSIQGESRRSYPFQLTDALPFDTQKFNQALVRVSGQPSLPESGKLGTSRNSQSASNFSIPLEATEASIGQSLPSPKTYMEFRTIFDIQIDGPDGKIFNRFIKFDAASDHNLISEGVMRGMGFELQPYTCNIPRPLGYPIKPMGQITLYWRYAFNPTKSFKHTFLVLASRVPVDLVLGLPCITDINAYEVNHCYWCG